MADVKKVTTDSKKGTNPLIFVGIGCLVLLVVFGVAGSFLVKFLAEKVGIGMLQSAIEKKTGVKTNLQDIEDGKMTFTDEKTGTKVDIGSGKIPDTFPKDFPVYPGAKVVSVLSGSEKGENSGFWITFSTPDSLDKVSQYYKSNLSKNGWESTMNYSTEESSTQTVSKGSMTGTVAATRTAEAKETDIMVVINEQTQESDTNGSE